MIAYLEQQVKFGISISSKRPCNKAVIFCDAIAMDECHGPATFLSTEGMASWL